jgi:hypothetical protein
MFVDMPLDNRTVYRLAAVAATSGFFRLLETVTRTKRSNVSPRATVL